MTQARRIVYTLCSWAHVNLQAVCRENGWPYEGAKDCPELVSIIVSRMGKPSPEVLAKLQALIDSRDKLGNDLPTLKRVGGLAHPCA